MRCQRVRLSGLREFQDGVVGNPLPALLLQVKVVPLELPLESFSEIAGFREVLAFKDLWDRSGDKRCARGGSGGAVESGSGW